MRILVRPVCVEVSCEQNGIGSAATTAIPEGEILSGGVCTSVGGLCNCERQTYGRHDAAGPGPAARQAVTPFRSSSHGPRSDTGLFLRCRHASWLPKPLNALGQGQGQRRISRLLGARHWPVSPPTPDSLRVHSVTLARAVAA